MGYHLGPQTDTQYASVAIPMFRNTTIHPQLEAQITNSVIRELQSEGELQVELIARADAIVYGKIVDYQRKSVRALQGEIRTVREYRITVTVEIELRDRLTGELLLKPTKVSESADVFIGSDLQSAEIQALPIIGEKLGRKVVTLLADRW